MDADSPDGNRGNIGRAWGAEVYSENELLPDYGPAQGKGDAMWRSLSVARGDIVMFADADTSNFPEQFIYGTLGPLITIPEVQFTKAAYRRPYTGSSQSVADGGGRVTELMAKPLFNFFCPELTGFVQPLAGEFAAYRDLLRAIPFLTGYGVELGIMVDVLEDAGLGAMAQVDLGARQNRHQSLWDLSLMSSAVLRAMASRASLPPAGHLRPWQPGGAGAAPPGGVRARGGHRLRPAAGRARQRAARTAAARPGSSQPGRARTRGRLRRPRRIAAGASGPRARWPAEQAAAEDDGRGRLAGGPRHHGPADPASAASRAPVVGLRLPLGRTCARSGPRALVRNRPDAYPCLCATLRVPVPGLWIHVRADPADGRGQRAVPVPDGRDDTVKLLSTVAVGG